MILNLPSIHSIGSLTRDVGLLAYIHAHRRYCGSYLGFAWSLLSPLATIGAYYIVFRVFFKVPIDNFAIYLSAGLMPWLCFVNSVSAASVELPNQRQVLEGNVSSPLIYLFATVVAEWVFLIVAYLALSIVIVLAGAGTWKMLAIPLFLFPLFVFTMASSVIVGYLGVHFRDMPHLLRIFFAAAFWFVPIVYHWSMVPNALSILIQYNPFSLLISPSQIILHGGEFPNALLVIAGYFLAFFWTLTAIVIHRRLRPRIVYYL